MSILQVGQPKKAGPIVNVTAFDACNGQSEVYDDFNAITQILSHPGSSVWLTGPRKIQLKLKSNFLVTQVFIISS